MIQQPIAVAVLDDFQKLALELADWRNLEPKAKVTVFTDHVTGEDLVRRLQPFQVLVLNRERTPMPRELLRRLPNLRMIATAGLRNRVIDLQTCQELGVLVSGTEVGGVAGTLELTWGLILACARHIVAEDNAMRKGVWQTSLGMTLSGKTLGILGLGRIGSACAAIGQAFGMNAIAWSQNLTAERAAQVGVGLVTKEELFRQSDVISIHLLLSERTRGLVGRGEFSLMKPSAIIVNTSRGPIIDQEALCIAIRNRQIGGAGLDVYDQEPLPADSPLLQLPNTTLTPHLGYVTAENYNVYYPQLLEGVRAWLDGSPVRVIKQ